MRYDDKTTKKPLQLHPKMTETAPKSSKTPFFILIAVVTTIILFAGFEHKKRGEPKVVEKVVEKEVSVEIPIEIPKAVPCEPIIKEVNITHTVYQCKENKIIAPKAKESAFSCLGYTLGSFDMPKACRKEVRDMLQHKDKKCHYTITGVIDTRRYAHANELKQNGLATLRALSILELIQKNEIDQFTYALMPPQLASQERGYHVGVSCL